MKQSIEFLDADCYRTYAIGRFHPIVAFFAKCARFLVDHDVSFSTSWTLVSHFPRNSRCSRNLFREHPFCTVSSAISHLLRLCLCCAVCDDDCLTVFKKSPIVVRHVFPLVPPVDRTNLCDSVKVFATPQLLP